MKKEIIQNLVLVFVFVAIVGLTFNYVNQPSANQGVSDKNVEVNVGQNEESKTNQSGASVDGSNLTVTANNGNVTVVDNKNNKEESKMETTGLKIETLKQGTGEGAKNNDLVSVHYTGTLVNGKKFDSSLDRGEPFQFTLGAGQVIKGWDQGVLGMKVGEKRKLTIPSSLGYGERGAGASIPPNADLIFEVEMIKIN